MFAPRSASSQARLRLSTGRWPLCGEPAGEFEARLRAVRALLSETLDRLDDASEAAAALDLGASTAAVENAERAYGEVLRRVQAGEQVEIVKSGVPVAVRRA